MATAWPEIPNTASTVRSGFGAVNDKLEALIKRAMNTAGVHEGPEGFGQVRLLANDVRDEVRLLEGIVLEELP